MLGTLMFLTVGALALAVLRVAAWWVVIPPGVMLGAFVLLREVSRSDAVRRPAGGLMRRRRAVARPRWESSARLLL